MPLSSYTSGECSYPFCETKGWFAFNEAGKGMLLLERLFWMLSLPDQPLSKHPGGRMRDAIRWMDRATADAHGVPPGCAGFELVDANIFSDEVYPQWRSGSFRKTAKHWGLTSPKPKQHSVRKLTPKCMYLPVLDEADQPAVDAGAAFKALPGSASLHALHEYVRTHIRPLEEAIKAKAAASTPRAAAVIATPVAWILPLPGTTGRDPGTASAGLVVSATAGPTVSAALRPQERSHPTPVAWKPSVMLPVGEMSAGAAAEKRARLQRCDYIAALEATRQADAEGLTLLKADTPSGFWGVEVSRYSPFPPPAGGPPRAPPAPHYGERHWVPMEVWDWRTKEGKFIQVCQGVTSAPTLPGAPAKIKFEKVAAADVGPGGDCPTHCCGRRS